jgi:hypothetical protein
MKRKEMINELTALLRCSDNINVPNDSYLNEEGLAKEILAFIEEEGMLPPNRPIIVPKMEPFEMIELDGVLIGTAPIVASVENSNTWEPEDNGLKK